MTLKVRKMHASRKKEKSLKVWQKIAERLKMQSSLKRKKDLKCKLN